VLVNNLIERERERERVCVCMCVETERNLKQGVREV
jgi:hypothetical protein